ncbi:hypothetical protein OROGR_004997 [Orobanche gracilis]
MKSYPGTAHTFKKYVPPPRPAFVKVQNADKTSWAESPVCAAELMDQ